MMISRSGDQREGDHFANLFGVSSLNPSVGSHSFRSQLWKDDRVTLEHV